MTRLGRRQGDGVANAPAACGPACLGCIAARCRYRQSRTAAATPRSSQPESLPWRRDAWARWPLSMRGDRTLSDGSHARSESAVHCRPACAMPKPSRDGRNTIANQQRLRRHCASLLWRACSVEVVAGRELPSLRCARRLHATAPAWQRAAEEPSRRAQERWRNAAAARPWGVEPDGADGVKCERTEKARGVSQGGPTRGACVGRVRWVGPGRCSEGVCPRKTVQRGVQRLLRRQTCFS
jgi:hypothetical protein